MKKRLMDDDELAHILLVGFLEDILLQNKALKGYVQASDVIIGGEALRAMAYELEKLSKSGD